MLRPQDLRGMYAIIPTPAKPGAERLDATDTVDLAETARLVEHLLRDGTTGLIALGTTGECATLAQADYEAFVDCVLTTVNKRVPTFIGTTALGGQEAVRRIRFVRERGADGTLLGLPMWQPCTTEMAVKYYAEMSALFPDLAIMVYANARAFRFNFSAEFWGGGAGGRRPSCRRNTRTRDNCSPAWRPAATASTTCRTRASSIASPSCRLPRRRPAGPRPPRWARSPSSR